MTDLAAPAAYLDKAKRALSGAYALLQVEDTEGACNRAYYAMFDATHAALWASGAREKGSVIKTHNGLVATFGECMVKTGKIAPEHGRALANVLKPDCWLITPLRYPPAPKHSCGPSPTL